MRREKQRSKSNRTERAKELEREQANRLAVSFLGSFCGERSGMTIL